MTRRSEVAGRLVRLVTTDELAKAVQDARGVPRPLFYAQRRRLLEWAVDVAGYTSAHEMGLWVPVEVGIDELVTEALLAGAVTGPTDGRWRLGAVGV